MRLKNGLKHFESYIKHGSVSKCSAQDTDLTHGVLHQTYCKNDGDHVWGLVACLVQVAKSYTDVDPDRQRGSIKFRARL